jgi:hypothetical protein
MKNLFATLSLVFCLLQASPASEASPPSVSDWEWHQQFRDANQITAENTDPQQALDLYHHILQNRGPSPALYANLAICHFKNGSLGWSRLYLERLQILEPHNPDWKYNLRQVMQKLSLEAPPETTLSRISTLLSSNQWFASSAILFALLVAIPLSLTLLGNKLQKQRYRALKTATLIQCTLLLALAILTFLLSREAGKAALDGIVVAPQGGTLRQSPFQHAESILEVPEGSRLTIHSQHQEFYRCRIPGNHSSAWIHHSEIEPIAPERVSFRESATSKAQAPGPREPQKEIPNP